MTFFSRRHKKDRPEPEKRRDKQPRNDEITVQVTDEAAYAVETAMATHIGTRAYQQDAIYVSESVGWDAANDMTFGILCDGMGGMDSGELASADVVEFMANRVAEMPMDADIAAYLEQSAIAANEMIGERYLMQGIESGTTMLTVVAKGDRLYWVSVGDSRIYIIRKNEIAQVTRDHNYALQLDEMAAAGEISEAAAASDPQREALVSYIGAPELALIDIGREFLMERGDIVLLCSDGLSKSLADGRILEIVERYVYDLREAAERLPLTAFDENAGEQDNTSVILIRYNGPKQSDIDSSLNDEIDEEEKTQIYTRSENHELG